MTPFGSDALGIPQAGLQVLRALIHERTGIFFDADRTELLAERVAPLVVERGFRSFLDLYYLLKYDESAAVAVWRQMMDFYFPDSAWLRLRRDTFDALHRFRGREALTTWEETIDVLLRHASADEREPV